jgi:hypothetical protein
MKQFNLDVNKLKQHPAFGNLSAKQQRFLLSLAYGMNASDAAKLAYDCKTAESARALCSKLLRTAAIVELIKAASPVPEVRPQPTAPVPLREGDKCGVSGCENRWSLDNHGVKRCGDHYRQENEAKQQAIIQAAIERQTAERARADEQAAKLRADVAQSQWASAMVHGTSGRVLDLLPDNGDPVVKALNERLTNEFWNPGSEQKREPRDWEG